MMTTIFVKSTKKNFLKLKRLKCSQDRKFKLKRSKKINPKKVNRKKREEEGSPNKKKRFNKLKI